LFSTSNGGQVQIVAIPTFETNATVATASKHGMCKMYIPQKNLMVYPLYDVGLHIFGSYVLSILHNNS